MRISWRPIPINSDLWVNVSFILISAQLLDLCTTFHLVHLTCRPTSHKTSLNGSSTMQMHRDTAYGILSQLHLVTTFKMTNEVMPFLKLLLDSGPVHICVTCRRPRLQRLLTEEIHRSRPTRVSYTSTLTEPFYYYTGLYVHVCTSMVNLALARSVAYWILAEYWRWLMTGQARRLSYRETRAQVA